MDWRVVARPGQRLNLPPATNGPCRPPSCRFRFSAIGYDPRERAATNVLIDQLVSAQQCAAGDYTLGDAAVGKPGVVPP